MRICEVALTASLAADHPEFSSPGQKVQCVISFPALGEDESFAKIGEILKSAALRLHHLEQYSICDRNDSLTGDPAIDAPMEEIRHFGNYFKISPASLK